MRIRRKSNTEKNLQNFTDFVIVEEIGEERQGTWRKFFSDDLTRELYVELGTGKGDFITEFAARNPDKNFIGLEMEREVVLKAARKIQEKNLKNVRLVIFDINNVDKIFARGEVDRLFINFCDPWPKKKHAKRRLTYVSFLDKYKKILKSGGEIHFKTDNRGLFDFSLEQFAEKNLAVSELTFDLHENEPAENIRTEYENKFSAQGFKINRCVVKF